MGMEDFHDRLCAFTSDCILSRQEWLSSGESYPRQETPQSLEQGDLFGTTPSPTPKEAEKVETKPIPSKPKEYPKPKTHYTFEEYLKFHYGNAAAADYWWKKDMQRLEAEQKCGHTA